MPRDGCGRLQTLNVLWGGIDLALQQFHIGPVAQSLNAASRRAGADSHQYLGLLPDRPNAPGIFSRGDGPFDQCNVVRPPSHVTGSFRKVRDVQGLSQEKEIIFQI